MWQPVLMISGYFISVLGLAMLFPAALDIYYSHAKWSLFILSIEKAGYSDGVVIIRYRDAQNVETKIQKDLEDI